MLVRSEKTTPVRQERQTPDATHTSKRAKITIVKVSSFEVDSAHPGRRARSQSPPVRILEYSCVSPFPPFHLPKGKEKKNQTLPLPHVDPTINFLRQNSLSHPSPV